MTTTTEHRTIQVVTTHALSLTVEELDRLRHAAEIGAERLAEDVKTFQAEATRLRDAGHTLGAQNMDGMAALFDGYVKRTLRAIAHVDAARTEGAFAVFGTFDSAEARSISAEVEAAMVEYDEAV
jgi:hypothetical protein